MSSPKTEGRRELIPAKVRLFDIHEEYQTIKKELF